MDLLLASYMAGECTPEEKQQIEDWAKASEGNQKEFNAYQTTWSFTEKVDNVPVPDVDHAWQKLKGRMQDGGATIKSINAFPPAKRSSNFALRIAAVMVVLVGIASAIFYLSGSNELQPMVVQTTSDTSHVTLPDGSLVVLNVNSKLTYPAQFAGEKRNVQLTGEAFFEVEKIIAHHLGGSSHATTKFCLDS